MTSIQRVIKYCAIAFAIFLIVTIVSSIGMVVSNISDIFINKNDAKISESVDIENSIDTLDVSLNFANLEIKKGDTFKVDTTNNKIKVADNNGKLVIKDTNKSNFLKVRKENVIVYIPSDYEFKIVKIESGAGKISVEQLTTNKLDMNLGAGNTVIDYLKTDEADIDTGAGNLEIKDGAINNAKIDLGVGRLLCKAILTGNSDINCGVGETNLTIGKKEDYTISFKKGIGSITYDNEKVANDTVIGDGENHITIDGGIGSIKVNSIEKDLEN